MINFVVAEMSWADAEVKQRCLSLVKGDFTHFSVSDSYTHLCRSFSPNGDYPMVAGHTSVQIAPEVTSDLGSNVCGGSQWRLARPNPETIHLYKSFSPNGD